MSLEELERPYREAVARAYQRLLRTLPRVADEDEADARYAAKRAYDLVEERGDPRRAAAAAAEAVELDPRWHPLLDAALAAGDADRVLERAEDDHDAGVPADAQAAVAGIAATDERRDELAELYRRARAVLEEG